MSLHKGDQYSVRCDEWCGCGRLARDLLLDGLLDLLVLSQTPVVAGAGRRLFDDPAHLIRSRITPDRRYNRLGREVLLVAGDVDHDVRDR